LNQVWFPEIFYQKDTKELIFVPIVDANRLKGNQAAFLVASWLSRQCLVRPVTEGTDVGIDLFCETVERTSQEPFLHFWVQVKSGKQIRLCGERAQCSFDCRHIGYWVRQPVPVYAFLLSEDQLQQFDKVFVISFVRKKTLGREVSITECKKKSLTSDLVYYTSGEISNLDTFVDTSVRVDYVLMHILRGVSEPLPDLTPSYITKELGGFRAPYALKVANQIRRSASATIRDILTQSEIRPEQERHLGVLAEVLRPYTQGITEEGYWEQHYEDYYALGLYLKNRGEIQDGNELLRRAIEIILEDEQFKARVPAWNDYVTEIQSHLNY
ncbi:MAG: DUF4365 domain-containing protein, partial [Phycisphaerae bacterium]|nr:DUF4365 domain-containing protein [Phycisphaerae bacterium]